MKSLFFCTVENPFLHELARYSIFQLLYPHFCTVWQGLKIAAVFCSFEHSSNSLMQNTSLLRDRLFSTLFQKKYLFIIISLSPLFFYNLIIFPNNQYGNRKDKSPSSIYRARFAMGRYGPVSIKTISTDKTHFGRDWCHLGLFAFKNNVFGSRRIVITRHDIVGPTPQHSQHSTRYFGIWCNDFGSLEGFHLLCSHI